MIFIVYIMLFVIFLEILKSISIEARFVVIFPRILRVHIFLHKIYSKFPFYMQILVWICIFIFKSSIPATRTPEKKTYLFFYENMVCARFLRVILLFTMEIKLVSIDFRLKFESFNNNSKFARIIQSVLEDFWI